MMRSVPLILAFAITAPAAHGAIITQTDSIASQPAHWLRGLIFAQANPANGLLTRAELELTGTVGGTLAVENRDGSRRSVVAQLAGDISAAKPSGGTFVTTNPLSTTSQVLQAFDGTVDFAGASGARIALANGSARQTGVISSRSGPNTNGAGPNPELAPFVGTSAVEIPVEATVRSRITVGGNATGTVQTTGGASGTLTYTQETPGVAGHGGSGGVIVTRCCDFPPFPIQPPLGTTAPQLRSIAPRPTGWAETLRFDPFDPALGALWSINVAIELPVHYRRAIENLDQIGIGAAIRQTAIVTLGAPNLPNFARATAEQYDEMGLGAFDLAQDGAGTSGWSAAGTLSERTELELSDAALLTLFGVSGPIDLALTSSGRSSIEGYGAFAFDLDLITGAQISLSYNYVLPPPILAQAASAAFGAARQGAAPVQTPAPGAGPALLAALALLALRRRR